MALLEPTVVPGLDKALLELFAIITLIAFIGLVVTVSSIVGIIRAVRRRRRGERSLQALVLAVIVSAIAWSWLLYWVGIELSNRSNPINALLAINAALGALPLIWLFTSIRANRTRRKS
jgi:hypothetical protein